MVRYSYSNMIPRRKIEITRMSSKGQVVIPLSMRKKLKLEAGTPLAVDTTKGIIVMKPISSPIDDRELRDVEQAWKKIERGAYKVAGAKEFIRELRKW